MLAAEQISDKVVFSTKRGFRGMRKGFTLVELMVVIVIIGILVSIAIPKFANIKDEATEVSCKCNLRLLGTAESIYYGLYETYTLDIMALNSVQQNASSLVCPLDHSDYAFAAPAGGDYSIICQFGISHGSIEDGVCSW
jgi:prepilin-type N-terminal cleavage/methylation domain-containing protein